MNNLLRISQVAKQYNISRPALIHYDNIGLLKPSYRNDKGYRFYNNRDLVKLEFIIALRESGLTIKEIIAHLESGVKESSVELLEKQQWAIDAKIEELRKTQKVLEERINLLKEYQGLEIYEGIKVEYYPELFISMERIGHEPLMGYESAKKRLKDKLDLESNITSKFGICFDITGLPNGKARMKYVCHSHDSAHENAHSRLTEASLYIKSIHYGEVDSAVETINEMIEYANRNGLKVGEEAFWIPLFNYWEIADEDEFINEILIPCVDLNELG